MSLRDELMEAGILTPETLKMLEANAARGLAEEAEEERRWLEWEERRAEREQKKAERDEKRREYEQKEVERISLLPHPRKSAPDEFDAIARIDRRTKPNRPLVVEMRNLESRGIRWLWPNRIPLGKLTLFSGDSGLGKSYVAMDIAARVTSGAEWPGEEGKESRVKEGGSGEEIQEESVILAPLSIGACAEVENDEKVDSLVPTGCSSDSAICKDDVLRNKEANSENESATEDPTAALMIDRRESPFETKGPTAGVLILSDDDEPEDTLMPRLEALGANVDHVRFMNGVERDDQEESVSLPDDIDVLERAIVETLNCKLVIIDPLASFLSSMGSGSLAKVRAALNPLKNLAKRHNVAIILINHLNKSSGNPLHRSAGSVSIMGVARTAWAFARCNHDPARCIMVPLKNNIGPAAEALSYVIDNDGLQWDDEPFDLSAADAFGSQDKIRGRNPHAVKEAVTWLEQAFKGALRTSIPQTEIEQDARMAGISYRTLERAKKKLGIEAKRRDNTWVWELSPSARTSATI